MKPLFALLGVLLAASTQAKPAPKPADESLLKAACETKGGLLMKAPDDDSAELPESLFGPAEKAEPSEPADKDKPGDKPKKVLHLKARGADPKKAKKECREKFQDFYARNGDLGAAIGPEIEGEISQADRARLLAVMTRSAPLQPLSSMSAKSIKDQQAMSRRLFDGATTIKADQLNAALARAEDKLDRRAADAAAQAAAVAAVHRADETRRLQKEAGLPQTPDLRRDPGAQALARGGIPSGSGPSSNGSYAEPKPSGAYVGALKDLTLAGVPAPAPIPQGGISRGSILADVKAALSGLGVNIMGRQAWNAHYGQDARQHTPMKITVHHSAGSPSHTDQNILSQIQGWEALHISKGFGRMGYHWVINSMGTVVEGQGTELVGSHTANNNDGNIGICLAGNYDIQQPTEKMLASLAGLMGYITTRYNMDTSSPNFVRGHEFYSRGRICPGVNIMSVLGQVREKAVALAAQSKDQKGVLVAAVVN